MPDPRYRVASPPASRPLLLWDGDCRFCQLWADRWSEAWHQRLEVAPARQHAARFPEIPPQAFTEAIQLIETDGNVYSGAQAALRARACGLGGRSLALWAYEKIPGVAPLAEAGYGVVARNRPLFSTLTRASYGANILRPRYSVAAGIFLRVLAAVFFVAFASFWVQLNGLIGPDGILPAQAWLDAEARQLGAARWWEVPTLCWFFGGGVFLHFLCAAGLLLSLALFFRVAQPVCLLLLWLGYLSLCHVGQIFLGYQWDSLLLETGLLAIFLAPWRLAGERTEPPRLARGLLWWLLFRLMLMSGAVKLLSGDPSWRDGTALLYHYQTQPLPTWLAWHLHQLPAWFHQATCGLMFAVELVAPFLLFGPRRLRLGAALSLIAFQGLIALSGNYTFFNLLTVALCLLFLDDAWWARWLAVPPRPYGSAPGSGYLPHWPLAGVFAVLFTVSVIVTLRSAVRRTQWPDWVGTTYSLATGAFRSVNSYGLFAIMTKTRPEIIIEGSLDGRTWEAYEFKWKPGNLKHRPGFVAPHQPRLDWQLWFAALDYPYIENWVAPFLRRLALNTPAVTGLLARNPFAKEPPRHLRAVLYEYKFTTAAERDRTGDWWKRTVIEYYLPPTPVR